MSAFSSKKLRVLCLHGTGIDGRLFKEAMVKARQIANLEDRCDFEFADAPYRDEIPLGKPIDGDEHGDETSTASDDTPEPVLPEPHPFWGYDAPDAIGNTFEGLEVWRHGPAPPLWYKERCWWRERDDGDGGCTVYEGAERSIAEVVAALRVAAPPYDVLLGHGSGGELAAVVLARQILGDLPGDVPPLSFGWIQHASLPRDGRLARFLEDGVRLRRRFHGLPKILVTARAPDADGEFDARASGPNDLAERLGAIFAAQYFGEEKDPTKLHWHQARADDPVTALAHAFFAVDAGDRMNFDCAACGKRATTACSRCRSAKYCSAACQRAHYPTHRDGCRALAAASRVLALEAEEAEEAREKTEVK